MRRKAAVVGSLVLLAAATVVCAQDTAASATGSRPIGDSFSNVPTFYSFGKMFTFLFVTLGPFKTLAPFSSMTRGRDALFKRRLAFQGTVIAALAAVASATLGARILQSWGISVGALLLTAGIVLFLVALRPVLEQYAPHVSRADDPSTGPERPVSALAFSPLAFPTIVTPYGVAVLIPLVTLARGDAGLVLKVLGTTGIVLLLDLISMLYADHFLNAPFVAPALGVVGSVLGVLQIALGTEAVVRALRLMDIVRAGSG